MAKVIIRGTETSTEISADGVNLSSLAQSFTLSQKAGEAPVLEISIHVDEIICDLPNSKTVINGIIKRIKECSNNE